MDAKINTILEDIVLLKNINQDLQRKNEKLENRLAEIESYSNNLYNVIYENEKELHALQQYTRRENNEIICIPDSISEANLEKTVINIWDSMGLWYNLTT